MTDRQERGAGARRGRPSAAEAEEKRQHIVAAATQLFLSEGYAEVSMRGVAQKADVSTRTLYNIYPDKAALFAASLDSIVVDPIAPILSSGQDFEITLANFASAMVRLLSTDQGIGFARLVMRNGGAMPELAAAGNDNQRKLFLAPLAAYLSENGFERTSAETWAELYIAMALSQWNRSVTFHLPLPGKDEIEIHARRVAKAFIFGTIGIHK